MTRDEYIALYEKFLQGGCTPDELKMLEDCSDHIHLEDDVWKEGGDKLALETHLLAVLHENMDAEDSSSGTPTTKYTRLAFRLRKLAAVLVAVSLVGFWLSILLKQSRPLPLHTGNRHVSTGMNVAIIKPGSKKAILTLGNGSTILLDDKKPGQIFGAKGFQIDKTKEGVLVYHFIPSIHSVLKPIVGSKLAQAEELQINTISTPRGGQYELVLADGTKVWLNAASSLRFPTVFKGNLRKVELTGEAYFEVVKNKRQLFQVQVGGTRVEVLGTHFNVNAYGDKGGIRTTLLEGSVRMVSGGSQVLIEPGQKAEVSANGQFIQVSKADLGSELGWKNGFFVFHEENLGNIMKEVSRWYDVDIAVDPQVKSLEFGGRIARRNPITMLMKYMELTRSFHYKITGRRIEIMR